MNPLILLPFARVIKLKDKSIDKNVQSFQTAIPNCPINNTFNPGLTFVQIKKIASLRDKFFRNFKSKRNTLPQQIIYEFWIEA